MLDEGLRDALLRHPELRSVLSKIDPEEQPSRYAAFVAKVSNKSSATSERMDGKSVIADFDNRYAAEIRLPEALEEKLLRRSA